MISIIIVGYNSRKDLKECFDSINTSSYKSYKIIFVDNASSDSSAEFIKKNYPGTIVINNKNNGYSGGNNVGIKKAIELKSDYIFILNPDTVLDKDCLTNLIKKAQPDTILQPLILLNLNGKNTNLINTTGGHLNFLGFSYCSDYKKNKSTATEKEIAIASGAAVFMPTGIFKKIGLFDESFFMYHEDVDLFWRARLFGYNIKLIPESFLWHKYSFAKNNKKMFYAERNRLLFLNKNFSLKYRVLIFPAFVINEVLMILYSLLTGWFLLKIKAYGSTIKLLRSIKKQLPVSKVPEKHLKQFLKAEINFSEVSNKLFIPYNLILKFYWLLIFKLI